MEKKEKVRRHSFRFMKRKCALYGCPVTIMIRKKTRSSVFMAGGRNLWTGGKVREKTDER